MPTRTLLGDTDVEVVAEAASGHEAIPMVEENRPDVVTMDIEIPKMNGLDAVEAITEECLTPVLMLSVHTEGDADVTSEAFNRGAVDFVMKSGGEVTSEMPRVKRELIRRIQSAAAVDLSAIRRGFCPPKAESKSPATAGSTLAALETTESLPTEGSTLIIGAFTGGPNVVERMLAAPPTEAGLHVLVAQHMPAGFTERFVTWLDGHCDYEARETEDGERVGPGQVRIAPGGPHLLVTDNHTGRLWLELSDDGTPHGAKPAIDLTMASAAETVDAPLADVLLMGTGRDDVGGITRIKRVGGHTVAQDEATSAVFGMPKWAIGTGCVDTVTADGRIADEALSGLTI